MTRAAPLLALAALAALALVPLLPGAAGAQGAPGAEQAGGVLDDAIRAMERALAEMSDGLRDVAWRIMVGLLAVELVWRGGRWAISGQGIEEVVEPMLYTLGVAALVGLMLPAVPAFVAWIADTALGLASAVRSGSADLSASSLVGNGMERAVAWLGEVRVARPGTYFYLVCAAVSIIVLAVEVAMYVVIYAELYLVGLAGIVALGFAGLSQTRDIAVRYVMALVGKGFKLMALLVIVQATHELGEAVARTGGGAGFAGAMGAILLQIVGLVLVMALPATMESLVAGASGGKTAETVGRMAGGLATRAVATAGGAAIGGAFGAAAGAAAGAKAAGGLNAVAGGGGRAVAAGGLRGMASGGGRGAADWGSAGARGRVAAEMGRRLGRGAGGGGAGADE